MTTPLISTSLKKKTAAWCEISEEDLPCLQWSFLMLFTVMSSSYIIFPLGEAHAMKAGAENVPFFSFLSVFLTLAVSPFYASFVATTPSAALVTTT